MVEDYDGALFKGGAFTPIPACMYVTERSICIDGFEKQIYAFKDITSITKDTTLPVISNAILKFQLRGEKSFFFVLYKGANKARETLESIWAANLNHWQSELAHASESNNSFTRGNKDATSSSSSSSGASPARNVLASKNTALLKRANAIQQFSTKFLVPEEPIVDHKASLHGIKDHSPVLVGTLTLTSSFVCWTNNTLGNQRMQLVIAAGSIRSLETSEFGFGTGVTTYVDIETDEGNRFRFAAMHPKKLCSEIDKMRERHAAFIARQTEKHLPASTTYALLRNGYQEDIERSMDAEHQDVQSRLQGHWEAYFKKYGRGASMILYSNDLDGLLKMGIPDIYRHELWPLLCGATHKLHANAGQYAEYLLDSKSTSTAAQDIDKDLHRSMPSHPYYASQPKNLEPLRNVLLAYATRNPSVGYCQGMNIVAAMLLLYLPEEVAFWVLTSIIEEIAPDYYNKQLFGSQVDQKVFNRLVKSKYPDLYAHLKAVGMPLHLLTLPWFMTFLIECVPWESSLIVLDNLFRNGTCVLFQVSLAILTLTYDGIMAETSENEQIPLLIREYKFDPFELMKLAFSKFAYIDVDSIRRMRTEGKAARLNDMQEAAHKQMLLKLKRKFKNSKNWSVERIDELDNYYRNHGKGNPLTLDAFKQLLLKYSPFIERNILKPEPTSSVPSTPTQTPPPSFMPASTTSCTSTSPQRKDTGEEKVSSEISSPNAPRTVASTASHPADLIDFNRPVENQSEKQDFSAPGGADALITPPVTPFVAVSPPPGVRTWELSPPMSVAFCDGVIESIWRSTFPAGSPQGSDLSSLITVLDIILYHPPAQVFTWLREVLYPVSEHPELDRQQFELLLLALYLLSFTGETPFAANSARIKQFVPLIYEQMGGNALALGAAQIQELVVDCELLEGFWSRLYYIDLGASLSGDESFNAESADLQMPPKPSEGEPNDLMTFSPEPID